MREEDRKNPRVKAANTNPKNGARGANNGFVFTSFYPTKEQKAEIRAMKTPLQEFTIALISLLDAGLVLSVKADADKNCFCLTIKENVKFGDPCKCMAFWHSDAEVLVSQLGYWFPRYGRQWIDDDRQLALQLEFDW